MCIYSELTHTTTTTTTTIIVIITLTFLHYTILSLYVLQLDSSLFKRSTFDIRDYSLISMFAKHNWTIFVQIKLAREYFQSEIVMAHRKQEMITNNWWIKLKLVTVDVPCYVQNNPVHLCLSVSLQHTHTHIPIYTPSLQHIK